MAGEFTKGTTIKPAVVGTIANPDDYNQNIAGQSKDSILGIDVDGNFADFVVGDETKGTNGSLASNIKLREGAALKLYNASGVFQNDVNLGPATTSTIGQSFLPSKITISNNSTDSDHDIDFIAGVMQFSDGSGQAVAEARIKQLDTSWVAGTNRGGLFSGTIAPDTWYYCFAIWNPTSNLYDAGFSTSDSASDIPSGYTKYQRVGVPIKTDGSSNIRGFKQIDQYCFFTTQIIDHTIAAAPTTPTNKTITAPPRTISMVHVFLSSVASCTMLLCPTAWTNKTSSPTNYNIRTGTSTTQGNNQTLFIEVDSNSQISVDADSGQAIEISTFGFIDTTF